MSIRCNVHLYDPICAGSLFIGTIGAASTSSVSNVTDDDAIDVVVIVAVTVNIALCLMPVSR